MGVLGFGGLGPETLNPKPGSIMRLSGFCKGFRVLYVVLGFGVLVFLVCGLLFEKIGARRRALALSGAKKKYVCGREGS